MCEYIDTFQRVEHKYLLTQEQQKELLKRIQSHLVDDKYPTYTLYNIYYDSTDSIMIMRSLMSPIYKEKLRLRSYGEVKEDTPAYLEIKKKFDGIVYKRRIAMEYETARNYLEREGENPDASQIAKEIDYVKQFYQVEPKVVIAYDRRAYAGKLEEDVRITFDTNIRYRMEDLSLHETGQEEKMLEEGQVLMEIKAMNRYPLWLSEALTELHLTRTSFSKYGVIYTRLQQKAKQTYTHVLPIKEVQPCLAQF